MKPNNILLILLIATVLVACDNTNKSDYKFQHHARIVNCKQLDSSLVKEAFYSFKEDVAAHYNTKNYEVGSMPYYHNGLVKYVENMKGGSGVYNVVASEHSKSIAKKLKEVPNLWIERDGKTYPNFDHSFIKCLLNNIDDFPMKSLISKVYAKGNLNRQTMLSTYEKNIGIIHQDLAFGMFVAMDLYYANLEDKIAE